MKAYEVIKSLCDSRGIPVTVLEAHLGFSRGSIGKMKNAHDAKSDRIKIIADYFGVSPEYMCYLKKEKPSPMLLARGKEEERKSPEDVL